MKFLCTIGPRRSLITACAIAALTLVLHACEKAPPKATQGVPRLSTPATLTTSKSEEKIVAGFPEEDRKAYLSQRANASVAVHVALLAVAFEYQTRGQHQQAARVLRRVVEIFPDFIAGWTELAGELTFFAPAEAEVAMQRARALDPDAVVSRPDVSAPDAGTQIERLLNRQKFREADALVDEFAPSLPDSDWGFLRMAARAKLNNRNPAAAIPYAEKALAIYPRDSETKVVLGIALARVGQAERGEKLLTEMASRFSREANFQAQLAEARIRADRKKEAEQPARRAVELAPDSPEAHQVLGAILTALSRYPEAISELQLSAEMDPNAALTWSTLANAYFGAGQFKEAVEASERAIALNPNDAIALSECGVALSQVKQWDKAASAFDRAARLDPNDAMNWNNLGFALGELKRAKEAVTAFERAVQLNPRFRLAWQNLSSAARQTGDSARAKTAEKKAAILPPDPPPRYRN